MKIIAKSTFKSDTFEYSNIEYLKMSKNFQLSIIMKIKTD